VDRRVFLVAVAGSLLAAPLAAEAQHGGKVFRVGFLGAATASAAPNHLQAFRQGLRDPGWVENRNIVIEDRWAEGKLARLTDLAADLTRLGVDVMGPTCARCFGGLPPT